MTASDSHTHNLLASISKIIRFAELDKQRRDSAASATISPLQEQLIEEIDCLERGELIGIVTALQQVSEIMDRQCQNSTNPDTDEFARADTPSYLHLNPLD